MKRHIILALVVIVIVGLGYFGYTKNKKSYHIHSDFALYINGEHFDFTQPEYVTSTDVCAVDYNSKHTHLHDGNGSVIHIHKKEQTVGDFFRSINFTLTDNSLTTNNEIVYRNDARNQWRFFINGVATSSLQHYTFKDLDQILLSYGDKTTDTTIEQSRITRTACVYSEKCEKPPDIVLPTERCGSDE